MKKLSVILMLLTVSLVGKSQSLYVNSSISVFNQGGTFEDKTCSVAEVGINANNTNFGLAFGTMSFLRGDTYGEFRVSPTLWSKEKVSVSLSLGAGTVFNTKSFLTEYGGSVNYNFTDHLSLSAGYGVFNISNKANGTAFPFFSSGLTYTF